MNEMHCPLACSAETLCALLAGVAARPALAANEASIARKASVT